MKKGFIDLYLVLDIVLTIITMWLMFGIFHSAFMPFFINIIDVNTPHYDWMILMITLVPAVISFGVIYGITQKFRGGGYLY